VFSVVFRSHRLFPSPKRFLCPSTGIEPGPHTKSEPTIRCFADLFRGIAFSELIFFPCRSESWPILLGPCSPPLYLTPISFFVPPGDPFFDSSLIMLLYMLAFEFSARLPAFNSFSCLLSSLPRFAQLPALARPLFSLFVQLFFLRNRFAFLDLVTACGLNSFPRSLRLWQISHPSLPFFL